MAAALPDEARAFAALEVRLRARLDGLTKPRGSLGLLEELAVQVGLRLGTDRPLLRAPQVLLFAADHGIADEGVSAYPQAVTAQMLANYLRGGAAINVLVRQHGLALTLVDAGVRGAVQAPVVTLAPAAGGDAEASAAAAAPGGALPGAMVPRLLVRRVGDGTRNFRHQPAMSPVQCERALSAGREVVAQCLAGGANVLLLGEMGIGNTASSALLLHRLTGWPLEACVGRGSGIDDAGLERKLAALAAASARRPGALGVEATLAEYGGFEIAMLVGAILEATSRPCVIVLDGFTVGVAALLAARLAPGVLAGCVFSHRSAERAHGRLLGHLGVRPLLELDLRLGEGSGAALAWPLLLSSLQLLEQMASFDTAGVSDRDD